MCFMEEKVKSLLIDIFDRINIQTPSNFDKILEFILKHLNSENINMQNLTNEDVDFGFKLWIESNNI